MDIEKALTPSETWDLLKAGKLYMDFEGDVPLHVWSVENDRFFRYPGERVYVESEDGWKTLWVRQKVRSICRGASGDGVVLNFKNHNGASGWYPWQNVRLEVGK